ncbi:MAG: MarC family protein [Gammaproteobacteria bacterium]|nr:MarC family protein [Gammaproteobacteria bacterium]
MNDALNAFIVLFIVIDPVGVAWMFTALTRNFTTRQQLLTALRGVAMATAILFLFYFAGHTVLGWMGISIPAFRIAGGILLFLLSLEMVFVRHSGLRSTTSAEQLEAESREDLSVFPLAFPLLAGPGALTTVMLMAGQVESSEDRLMMSLVIAVIGLVTLLALLVSRTISGFLGETGANVISRLLGLVLAALAVQFVIDGIRQSFFV